ncbi:TonB-dependent receptor [Azoarcus sp. L1K30]|uniref:TonB-dependent receptor family protein n=1 Tax=Azoarcus sp. L1K30 TaxID=2820277 RepID=UPI001B84592B|nr:TonB-dependent receptor [Azoarcus sp. L1K30]MBR0568740.1 TonB-dependent receptor [Azoarcus sp. L1K30]
MHDLRPRTAPLRLVILLALGFTAGTACAQEQTLGTVVITGSRVEVSPFDVPYSVEGVPLQENAAQGLRVNVSEVLAGVPGVVVQNRQNYAQDLQISVRGFGARAAFGVRGVKLVADGIPATNPDGQGQAATFNLDTAERIEVLRGPFATVYGNHAGGVIQLFSRDGKGAPRIRAGVAGGDHGTLKVDIGAEGEKDGVGYVLDASHFETDGERDYSAATRDQAFAKLTLAPDEDSKLTLLASGLRQPDTEDPLGLTWDTWKRDATAVEAVALQYKTRKSIEHMQGGAVYERRFGEDKLQVQAYAGQRSVIQYQSIPKVAQSAITQAGGVIDFDRSFHGLGARWIAQRTLETGKLTVTGGLDYDQAEDDRQGYQNFIGNTLGVKGALRRDEIDTVTSLDPYAQLSWQQGDWDWSVGVRHSNVKFDVDDHFIVGANGDDSGSVSYSRTTPAIGVLWRATPLLNLYASFGTGFETPTLGELSYAPSGGFNFDLKASRSRQFELGLKTYAGETGRINAALFQITTDDEIVVAGSSGGRTSYTNAGRTLRQGLELAAETGLTRTLSARGALTVMRAVYDEAFDTVPAGNRIPGVPAVSAYGELAWKPVDGLSTAVEVVHRSKVQVNDNNTDHPAPSYTLMNLRLGAEQQSGPWTFNELLRLDNLFDRKYIGSVIVGDRNGRYYEPGPGRGIYGGIRATYRF